MSEKSSGIDFDRQAFVPPQAINSPPALRIGGLIFALIAIAAIAFLGYKLVPEMAKDSGSPSDPALAELGKRLAAIDARLEKQLTEDQRADLEYQFRVIYTLDAASKSNDCYVPRYTPTTG